MVRAAKVLSSVAAWGPAVCALWLASAAGVQAQQKSVSVLGLMSEDGDDALAAKLTDAVRAEASEEDDWRVAPSGPSLSQLSMAFDCELRNPRCLREMTANLGMDLIVYGTLHREGAAVAVEVGLFDVYGARSVALAHATLGLDSEAGELRRAAGVLVAGLRGREASAADDAAAVVAAEGAGDAEAEATDAAEPEPYADVQDESEGSQTARWVGYGLLGAAGVSAVMTVVSWALIGSASGDTTFEAYRTAIDASGADVEDSCVEADAGRSYGLSQSELAAVQDVCARGKTWEVLQYVFLGATIATGAAGAIVLLTAGGDDDERASAQARAPRLSLTPAFSRDGGSLQAKLRF